MSAYSLDYLRSHTRVGDVEVNGLPWTARALGLELPAAYKDTDSNGNKWLYKGAVPLKAARELFSDYEVVSHPLAFVRPMQPWDDPAMVVEFDGQKYAVVTDDTRQIVADAKTDKVHFVPKDGYQIHPFSETLIDRTARIVGESSGDLHIDAIGVLADGAEGWVSISTGKLLSTPQGVDYYPHILAAGSHNGTLSSTLGACVTLAVCDNTRAAALGEMSGNDTRSKIKHTRMSNARLAKAEDEARQALGLLETANDTFTAELAKLCETTVTDRQWQSFIETLAPIEDGMTKNAITRAESFREQVTELYRADNRAASWNGTAFGALQAVNTFDLWERGIRGEGADHYSRMIRENITGKAAEREAERAAVLAGILANA